MAIAEYFFEIGYKSEANSEPGPAARAFALVLQRELNDQLPGLRSWVDTNNPTLVEIDSKAFDIYSEFPFSSDNAHLVALVHANEKRLQAVPSPIKKLFEAGNNTSNRVYMYDNKCLAADLNRI